MFNITPIEITYKNKCPYCNKKDCVPLVVSDNTITYGNRFHIAKCIYCKEKIQVICHSEVIIDEIVKTNQPLDYTDAQMEV
jgi:hypothetical protein